MVVVYAGEDIKCRENSRQKGSGTSKQLLKNITIRKRKTIESTEKIVVVFTITATILSLLLIAAAYWGESEMQNRFPRHPFCEKIRLETS